MSKFIPQVAVQREQMNQMMRRFKLEAKQEMAVKAAKEQFDAQTTAALRDAEPSTLNCFQTLAAAGLTERHALTLLGRWLFNRLEAEKQAPKPVLGTATGTSEEA